jgi:GAF domain-containing protein
VASSPDRETLGQVLVGLEALGLRRAAALLRAQEDEWTRRLIDAQERAVRAEERARELGLRNADLQKAEAQSQRRADQISLLNSVARRVAQVLDPERLMQDAADVIRASLSHTYVAVVVLDDEGVLVGRWAGRPGVGRRSAGRAQGLPRGVIGRAIRKRAPQVVGDVGADPDYHADVPGTASEMVVPLFDGGEVVGAMDFQSERKEAFGSTTWRRETSRTSWWWRSAARASSPRAARTPSGIASLRWRQSGSGAGSLPHLTAGAVEPPGLAPGAASRATARPRGR